MSKSYKRRFHKFPELLSNPKLINYARHPRSTLLYCLSKKGLTTSFELRNYLKEKIEMFMQLSVQGYLQHRKHLNLEIFLILSGNTLWFSIILVDQNYKNMLSDC